MQCELVKNPCNVFICRSEQLTEEDYSTAINNYIIYSKADLSLGSGDSQL